MQGKKSAIACSIINSIGNTVEEQVLTKFDESEYLFWSTLVIGIMTLIFSIFNPIEITPLSFGILIIYSIAMIGGDYCYVKALTTLPIGLAQLISTGNVFIILICDIFLGYITPKFIFLILFFIYFGSVYIFSIETNKLKNKISNKKINLKNIFILITSTIFYASEPYFIKLASSKGANEFGINLTFYLIATPFFFYLYQKEKKEIPKKNKKETKEFFKYILLLGIIYTIIDFLYMYAFIGETPIIVTLIMNLQIFFVVIISVIRKTDKMNTKKTISLIVGILCIIMMTLFS